MPEENPSAESAAPSPATPDDGAPITCHTTRWYSKRMALMGLMVFAFGCWFLYDGLVVYPKKIAVYSEYQNVTELEEKYADLEKAGRLAEYPEFASARDAGPEKPPSWRAISTERGIALEPDEKEPGDEKEQLVWAGIALLSALIIAVVYLLNRGKKITADASSFTTPDGKRVPFDSVFRIDKRKWRYKGLAFAHYTDADGKKQKAVLDDLKYGGTDKILDRLLGQFSGELIDRVEEPEESTAEPAEKP